MLATTDSIELAGSPLGDCRHVCAFFMTADDEYRTLLPFVQDGLDRGERSVNVLPRARDEHVSRLRAAGVDVESAFARHQLEVLHSEDTYTRDDGCFDQARMLSLLPALLEEGRRLGYPRTRLVAHAEFMLAEANDSREFVEYEARLNVVLPRYPDVVICSYDLGQVGAAATLDALRTHPMVIIAGVLRKNSFYVSPEQFIGELRGRPRAAVNGRTDASRTGRRSTAALDESCRGM
jgi:hypothetical protein